MTKGKSLGLAALFFMIAVFVSGSLVVSVHQGYTVNGRSPALPDAIHLLQKA
jgi:hypothetical protein